MEARPRPEAVGVVRPVAIPVAGRPHTASSLVVPEDDAGIAGHCDLRHHLRGARPRNRLHRRRDADRRRRSRWSGTRRPVRCRWAPGEALGSPPEPACQATAVADEGPAVDRVAADRAVRHRSAARPKAHGGAVDAADDHPGHRDPAPAGARADPAGFRLSRHVARDARLGLPASLLGMRHGGLLDQHDLHPRRDRPARHPVDAARLLSKHSRGPRRERARRRVRPPPRVLALDRARHPVRRNHDRALRVPPRPRRLRGERAPPAPGRTELWCSVSSPPCGITDIGRWS